jgi:hypothetical protein
MKTTISTIALLVALAAVPGPATAQAATPVAVDGDTLARIVQSHPGEPALLAAGAIGLYQLDGETWTMAGPAPPEGQLVSSGGDAPVLLAGDHAACMMGGAPVTLQRSEDGGGAWTAVAESTDLRPLAVWPDSGVALAASCAGLQLSLDLGLSWALVPGIEPGWDQTAFAEVVNASDPGPVVLVGLTSEGGTTQLRRVDLSEPAAPVVSGILREYYAIGGLAGQGDTYVLAAMDGAWISPDAGVTWERSAEGLEGIVLERDPLEFGLPQDLDPRQVGLYAVSFIPGTEDGLVAGSADGLYLRAEGQTAWARIEATAGRVHEVVVSAQGQTATYRTDDGVFQVSLGMVG